MKGWRYVLAGMLTLFGSVVWAQDPDVEGMVDLDGTLTEVVLEDEGTETLLLDNTRTKIGRDFYDFFFRRYAELPKTSTPLLADSSKTVRQPFELELNAFFVTIEELPALGVGTTIISVSLNDQLVWQNFVQFRLDIIEAYAVNAAEVVNQYILNYQDVQRQLESEDQQGSGLY